MRFNSQKAKCALVYAGKTQGRLAEDAVISRPCVCRALNGGSINVNSAKRIATALGVPLEELLESGE